MDIEQLLADGHTVQVTPEGYSMYPLFVPGRDQVIIAPLHVDEGNAASQSKKTIRRGDVVLYRRGQDLLVLHRVVRVRTEGFYAVGDNQTLIEGPIQYEQLRGRMTGFIRNGKEGTVCHPLYQIYSRVWLFLRPVRHRIAVVVHAIKQKVSKKNG